MYFLNKPYPMIFYACFSLLASFLITYILSLSKKTGQPISTSVSWHLHKQGTPTMGGIGIMASFLISSAVFGLLSTKTLWLYSIAFASFVTGLLDDLHKIYYQDNKGLGKLDKLWFMLASIGGIFCLQYGKYAEMGILFGYLIPAIYCIIGNKSISFDYNFLYFLFTIPILLFLNIVFGWNYNTAVIYIFYLGRFRLSSSQKCTLLSFVLLASAAVRIFFLGESVYSATLPAVSVGITIFFAAAFDLLDGLDGLLASIAGVIFFTLGLLVDTYQKLFFLLCGAILGFWALNAKPARIFMGDCGSLALGSIFGASMIALWTGAFGQTLPLWSVSKLAVMFAIVPLLDFASVGFNIILAKLKLPRFFFAPIHHELEKRMGEGSTTKLLFFVNVAFCIISFFGFAPQLCSQKDANDPLLFPGRSHPDSPHGKISPE